MSGSAPGSSSLLVKISEWKRSKRAKRVEFPFLLLILLLFRPSTCLYTQCLLSVLLAFSFHMPPAVSIVLHFCLFTPYTTTLPLRLYHTHTSSALPYIHQFRTSTHRCTFQHPSLAGALFNTPLNVPETAPITFLLPLVAWAPSRRASEW